MKFLYTTLFCLVFATAAFADLHAHVFKSIDGGDLDLADWDGRPVLVINTASQCGYTKQYAGLQTLYDRYREDGLVVFAVPSNDFDQEFSKASEVKEFCEMNFGLDMPMADITHVKGQKAHSFYKAVKAQSGFVPSWNFNKVLINANGEVAAIWGARIKPTSVLITKEIEALLEQAASR